MIAHARTQYVDFLEIHDVSRDGYCALVDTATDADLTSLLPPILPVDNAQPTPATRMTT